MKRLLVLTLAAVLIATAAGAGTLYDPAYDAGLKKTVLFIGDSNYVRGATALTAAIDNHSNGYLPIFTPRGGLGIRGYKGGFCPPGYSTCPNPNYWQTRLAQVFAAVQPDAIVIDLGINDTATAGTATTSGYGNYAQKIAWLLSLLPAVPVFWSNLPKAIEPHSYRAGCDAVNQALAVAPINLIRWAGVASSHPEYITADDIHYTDAGYTAYASMVVQALDATL